MTRLLPLALLVAVLLLAPPVVTTNPSGAQDAATPTIPVEPNGAAGGQAPAIVVNGWDIRGQRNMQGGWLSNNPETLNLDIGAGSTANPGWLVFNYDIGKGEKFFAGQGPSQPTPLMMVSRDGIRMWSPSGRLLAWFGERITYYVRPRAMRCTRAIGRWGCR